MKWIRINFRKLLRIKRFNLSPLFTRKKSVHLILVYSMSSALSPNATSFVNGTIVDQVKEAVVDDFDGRLSAKPFARVLLLPRHFLDARIRVCGAVGHWWPCSTRTPLAAWAPVPFCWFWCAPRACPRRASWCTSCIGWGSSRRSRPTRS